MSVAMQTATPMEVPCRACDGRGDDSHLYAGGAPDPDFCPDCGGAGMDFVDLATLGHNLAVAGALCRAFDLGVAWEAWWPNVSGDVAPSHGPDGYPLPDTDGRSAP